MKQHIHLIQWAYRFENGLVAIGLFLMAFIPLIEILSRIAGYAGLSGSTEYVQHLTLWVGFLGAILAAKEGRHLSMLAGVDLLPERIKHNINIGTTVVSTAVCGSLLWAGLELVHAEYGVAKPIAGWLPQWIAIIIMPIGFGMVALRLIWHSSDHWMGRSVAAMGPGVAALLGFFLTPGQAAGLLIPGLITLVVAGILGSPIFIVIGGSALLLFFAGDVPVATIPVEAYRIVTSPVLPTIPLFTLAGFILAEGGASHRFVRLFRALFGWIPGGAAVAAAFVCAFFTTFTGASGVTILALGGLLYPVLLQNGFKKRFAVGLLTSTGSLGLLFPPSLVVILYGVIAKVPIDRLFIAGFVPGMLLLIAISMFGIRQGLRSEIECKPFQWTEAISALWESRWEIALPFIVIFSIFGGYTTPVEAAAITVIYALITQCLIHRDIKFSSGLLPIFIKSATLAGGILIILSVAMGLTSYLVDAEIPVKAAGWVKEHIESRLVFLLMLNLFLLLIGCLMDIYSAIVVVLPLIIPMGEAFAINPLHLGIIFLSNLELGYLTPPVGINLFLSSYRFERSLVQVYRDTIPFFLLLFVVVLLITYVPFLTLGFATK